MSTSRQMGSRFMVVSLSATLVFAPTHLSARENQGVVTDANKAAQAKVYDIKKYGALGDGVAVETQAIQEAIDACHGAGGGVVRVPAGDFQIGTICLKSNITLSLDYGASLLGSKNLADYPTEGLDDPREGGPHCLIYAKDATNTAIEGLGVIDGTGIPGHCIEDIKLENIKISFPGHGTAADAERAVPEDIARYPEQFFFGVLPSWGAYIRHARNIEFINVELETRTPDARKKSVLEDVEGFVER